MSPSKRHVYVKEGGVACGDGGFVFEEEVVL